MTETQAKPPRSLGAMASRGAAVTLGGQGLRMILQLGGIILLARLLDPSDYGLLAMVTAVIGIGELVRDFGLSSAAIQAKTLTKGQKSNLFWVNSGIGLVLAIVATAAAGLIAQLYGDDRVQVVTMVLSLTFLLNGISTQFRADLARNFLFGKLAASEIAGQAFGIAAGIVFALLGFGYWALVIQQLTQVFITQVFLLIVTPWSPGWIDRKATIRPFLNYGVNVLGTQLIGYVARNVDSVVIGTRFGAYDLGLYNRAFQLMMMPLLQIQAPSTRVALPVLSRLQDQRERFASFINVGQTALIGLVGFAFAALGAQAPAAVSLFLGPQWLASAPLLQALLVAGFFQAAAYATYWVFLAKGLTRSNFFYALVTRPFMIALILTGSIWGVTGVAFGYALANALVWPVALIWIAKVSDAPALSMFFNGVRALVVFGSGAAASWGIGLAMPEDASLLRIAMSLVTVAAVAALAALIWPRYRADIVGIAKARKHFTRRGRSAAATEGTTE